jgi:Putative DNA-binding domain
MYPDRFVELAMRASRSSCEVTFAQLSEVLQLDSMGTLQKVDIIRETLGKFGLHVLPGFDRGEMETVRVCGTISSPKTDLRQDLLGEGALCEYKASFCFDYHRFEKKSDLEPKYYENEDLQFVVLKTIAAFLNSSGGKLFVGVNNDGTICGISRDYAYCKSQDVDGWELKLRDLIKARFYEGDIVNNYVQVEFQVESGEHFCRIAVIPRSRLSFVKTAKDDRYGLFIRQGNRTIELAIQDVEDFLSNRK